MSKKILTFILALAMVLCLVPTTAFAKAVEIKVLDSNGVQLEKTDSRISISGNTLTVKGSDLTVTYGSTGAFDIIDPEECDLVIESEGTVTFRGANTDESKCAPLYLNSLTINKGSVVFDTENTYEAEALYCHNDFNMTGGSLTFKDTNVEDTVLGCANFSISDGTIDIDYPDCDAAISVRLSGEGTGNFNMTGGTININVPGNADHAIYTSTFNMSDGEITATSDDGIYAAHSNITGGKIASTSLDGKALNVIDCDISNCEMTLNSTNNYAFCCGIGLDIEEKASPIKIHDCKLTAIATGTDSYAMLSIAGFDFSNVELYASGEMGAIVCANEPEYEFIEGEIENLAAPFTFSSDMKLCGSNTFKDDATALELTVKQYESELQYGSCIINFRILSVDGTTPALTVANNIYKITDGANQTWTKGSGKDATFTSNASFDKFKALLIDDKEVDKANYTVKEGSTIVDIKAAFLETLSSGKHMLEIASTNGSARTEFTIADAAAPAAEEIAKTGDYSIATITAISTLAATAFCTSTALGKKGDNN